MTVNRGNVKEWVKKTEREREKKLTQTESNMHATLKSK